MIRRAISAFLIVLFLSPVYSGAQATSTETIESEVPFLDFQLIESFPSTAMNEAATLRMFRTITRTRIGTGGLTSIRHSYSSPGYITVSDSSVEFQIRLSSTATLLPQTSDFIGYPVVFGIGVKNKTAEPAYVSWDNVAYIDAGGLTHKVVKSGTKFDDRTQDIGEVIIPPGARIDEIMQPTDSVYYDTDKYTSGWRGNPVLEKLSSNDKVTISFPIRVHNKTIKYFFIFKVKKTYVAPAPATATAQAQAAASSSGGGNTPAAFGTYEQAQEFYLKSQYRNAIDAFQSFIDGSPTDPRVPGAVYKQGISMIYLKDKEGARRYFQSLIDKYPDSEEASQARGTIVICCEK